MRNPLTHWRLGLALSLTFLLAGTALAGGYTIESKDGKSSIKFGFLTQMRVESLDTADGEDSSNDLYFRRLRLLAGGKIGEKWSFFLETDSPNLGKGNADGSKSASDIFIQDFVVTYNHSKKFKVDMGMLLPPLAHNSNNSAAKLVPTDYGPYSFLHSGPTQSRVGRDYGAAIRGHVANEHLEYRFGVYQGVRGEGSTNGFRYSGRAVFYPFEAETGLFYTGTSLGKKRVLAFGAGFDKQEEYTSTAVDVFWDQPVGNGDGITFQAGLVNYDGDTFLESLPEQDATMVELAYYFASAKLQAYAAFYERDFDSVLSADEERFEVGVGFYPRGYSRVLKISYGQISKDGLPDRDRFLVQLQLLAF